jgi:hypothetical protein
MKTSLKAIAIPKEPKGTNVRFWPKADIPVCEQAHTI